MKEKGQQTSAFTGRLTAHVEIGSLSDYSYHYLGPNSSETIDRPAPMKEAFQNSDDFSGA